MLFPDFPTGGSVDVAKYNDGLRGGAIKVRAKIDKRDSKTLVISLKYLLAKLLHHRNRVHNKGQ
jgi:hypothetical protein